MDEKMLKLKQDLLKATEKGRVQDWIERMAEIAKKANLPLHNICWQGAPIVVADNLINYLSGQRGRTVINFQNIVNEKLEEI